MIVIGLTGLKRSGKNTVAKMIKEWAAFELALQTNELAFADPVVKTGCGVLGIDVGDWEALKGSPIKIEMGDCVVTTDGREVVRGIGMAMVDANPSLLVDSVQSSLRESGINIITDVRRPHERDWLAGIQSASCTSVLIHIERDGVTSDGHVTETPLDKVEGLGHVIRNDGTYSDLRDAVFDWCEDHLYKIAKEKQCH